MGGGCERFYKMEFWACVLVSKAQESMDKEIKIA